MNNNKVKPIFKKIAKVVCLFLFGIILINLYSVWSGTEIDLFRNLPFTTREYLVKPNIDRISYSEKKSILDIIKKRFESGKEDKNAFGNGLNFSDYINKLYLNDDNDLYTLVDNLNQSLKDTPFYDFQRKYNYNIEINIIDLPTINPTKKV